MQATVPHYFRRPLWLGGLLILALAGGWWRWGARAATSAPDASGTRILLGLAADALRDGRLVAPVGSNVFELCFSVLQLDPHNATALEQLRTAFKPASDVVEQTIAAGELDEAQRELQLLRAYDAGNYQYDPAHFEVHSTNYRLALLGSYLDAQRSLQRQRHAAEAAAISARLAAAQPAR
jgi:hypothetical protein